MIRTEKNGVSWYEFSIFGPDVRGVVTTRRGGVSRGIYENLNMSFFLGDEEAHVKENRIRVMTALGCRPERAVGAVQVHGTHIAVVDESMAGCGGLSAKGAIPETDGLVTDASDLPLTLLFADCTPLLFSDPVKGVIGLAHGGWRGSAGNIAGKMVELMKEKYGCRPENIRMGIGPCIGSDSFEVGSEVVEAFIPFFSKEEMARLVKARPNGKYLFNLPLANALLAIQAGITEDHIEQSGIDTMTSPNFYSYRRSQGKCGRHAAVIVQHGGKAAN